MKKVFLSIWNYFAEFGKLAKLPKEFWGYQALNTVYCLVYFAFVTINSIHLSQDVGFSNEAAGLMVAMFMTGTAILQIFMGPILDWIGFRKTPLIAATIVTVGFLGIGASPLFFGATPTGRGFVFFFYLVAMVGNGLMFPTLTAGTKRYSNKETMNTAFNFWYLTMQVGAALLFVIDYMRRTVPNDPTPEQLLAFRDAGGNSHMFWFFAALSIICCMIVYFSVKKEAQFKEFKDRSAPETNTPQEKKPIMTVLKTVLVSKAFLKIIGFLVLTIPAHVPFVLPFVLYPKYYLRVLGSESGIGLMSSLNPMVIIPCLILLAPAVKRFNAYWVLVVGMIIASLSMMILAIPPQWVAGVLNIDLRNAYLVIILAQIGVFAVGESIWSPQLQSFVATFADEGTEGTFMGVTRFPHTTAKFVAGAASGFLISHYCSKEVTMAIDYFGSPEMMNFVIGLFCLISPISILLLKKYLYIEKQAE